MGMDQYIYKIPNVQLTPQNTSVYDMEDIDYTFENMCEYDELSKVIKTYRAHDIELLVSTDEAVMARCCEFDHSGLPDDIIYIKLMAFVDNRLNEAIVNKRILDRHKDTFKLGRDTVAEFDDDRIIQKYFQDIYISMGGHEDDAIQNVIITENSLHTLIATITDYIDDDDTMRIYLDSLNCIVAELKEVLETTNFEKDTLYYSAGW